MGGKEVWMRQGIVSVGYVHCCATEPRSQLGKELWQKVCSLAAQRKILVVACHSILLQGTVDFWRAQGMRKMDVDDATDKSEFRQRVHFRSQGMLHLELESLVQALPKSALPLFVWINAPSLDSSMDSEDWVVINQAEHEEDEDEQHQDRYPFR